MACCPVIRIARFVILDPVHADLMRALLNGILPA
jgi:hypothetical protein